MDDDSHEFEWTVMVYLAGDNNLTEECVYSLKEMKKLDTGDRIRVTAQFDPRGRKTPVHRYVINKPKPANHPAGKYRPGKISDDVVPVTEGRVKYPHRSTSPSSSSGDGPMEVNTGDPKTLFDFISWSIDNYRAKHYMVILSGHGAGTEEDFLLKDENPRSSLSIPDLRRVFRAVKEELPDDQIDIIGMDVCLMSMGEVCYALSGLAQYIISAEGYSATAGWPYGSILAKLDERLLAGTEVQPKALGQIIVNEYTNYYSEYMAAGFSSDMSLMDVGVDAMTSLTDSINTLTGLLVKELSLASQLKEATGKSEFLDQIVLAHWEAQSYNGERFADLYDFCDLLDERYPVPELPEEPTAEELDNYERRKRLSDAIGSVKTEILERVVKLSCYSGVDYQYSYGLSVYFPWAEVGPHYKKLGFAKVTGWNTFLQAYTEATRRAPRGYVPGAERLWRNVEKYRTGGYRTGGYRDPGLNPIYSMRNPPFTLTETGQSSCLREEVEMIRDLDFSFFR